jgi:hypothetical protein
MRIRKPIFVWWDNPFGWTWKCCVPGYHSLSGGESRGQWHPTAASACDAGREHLKTCTAIFRS